MENMTRAKGHQHSLILLMSLTFCLMHLGCGKKSAPVPPRVVVPPPVRDLKAEPVGDEVRLTWTIPKKGDTIFEGIKRFRVFKHKAHGSVARCPGCPIRFDTFFDIRLKDPLRGRVEGDRVICYDKIKSGYRHAYKVVVYHQSGGVSEASNIVELTAGPRPTKSSSPPYNE